MLRKIWRLITGKKTEPVKRPQVTDGPWICELMKRGEICDTMTTETLLAGIDIPGLTIRNAAFFEDTDGIGPDIHLCETERFQLATADFKRKVAVYE